MYRTNDYDCYSMSELLIDFDEAQIQSVLNGFTSLKNKEIQDFLINNAIEFTKKHQAITYLIFDLNM